MFTKTPPVPIELRRHSSAQPWTYADLDLRQRQIAGDVRQGLPGALLISEVQPVITVGRRTPGQDLLLSHEKLEEQGISLHQTDRGGFATWHGPGQWVVFAVDRLEVLTDDRRGVRRAVEGLLSVALEVGLLWDKSAEIRSGCEMGVWGKTGKFAAVGVHIEQGVLLHGLAINAFKTPTSFVGLKPCGLDAPVSFLFDESLARPKLERAFDELKGEIIQAIFRHFWARA